MTGTVTFDVTADAELVDSEAAPNYGRLTKKVDEGASGWIELQATETGVGPGVALTWYEPGSTRDCRTFP